MSLVPHKEGKHTSRGDDLGCAAFWEPMGCKTSNVSSLTVLLESMYGNNHHLLDLRQQPRKHMHRPRPSRQGRWMSGILLVSPKPKELGCCLGTEGHFQRPRRHPGVALSLTALKAKPSPSEQSAQAHPRKKATGDRTKPGP